MTTILCWIILDGGTQPVPVKIGRDKDVTALCLKIIQDDKVRNTCRRIDWGNVQVPDLIVSKDRLIIGKESRIGDLPEAKKLTPINVRIRVAEKNLTSVANQAAASGAISTKRALLREYGSLPSSFRFDATDESAVFSLLCPDDNDILSVKEDMPLMGELMHMSSRGETARGGVNSIFISSSKSLFHAISNGTTTLQDHELGLATPGSECDHLMIRDRVLYGIIELKGGESSPFYGSRQSAVYSSHFAMKLLQLGVPRERVIVPSYTYTGMQIQFGVTIVLAPSFPVFRTISKVLDMGDMHERQMAVAYIQKATSWIDILSLELRAPVPVTDMKLNLNAYHIQTITREYAKKGFLLFAEDEGGVSQGVEHWGRVLNILYSVENLRPCIAFPLAIRSDNLVTGDDIIIYNDYYAMGYRIGCPHRTVEKREYVLYQRELARIMGLVHTAGVIHCDLCSSNRSRINGKNVVSIIITGWECAHYMMEGRFHTKVQTALDNRIGRDIGTSLGPAVFRKAFDHLYMQVLSMEFRDIDRIHWVNMASENKELIDTAFKSLFVLRHSS